MPELPSGELLPIWDSRRMQNPAPGAIALTERLLRYISYDPTKYLKDENGERVSDCWLWTGALDEDGYGKIHLSDQDLDHWRQVHRVAYELWYGIAVPDGKHLHHECGNKNCFRPDHMEPLTPREHNFRSRGITEFVTSDTHCWRGHELTEENIYKAPDGREYCRECRREWEEDNKEKRRRYTAKWAAANPEKLREINRKACAKWRAANPNKARKASAEWRAANPEKARNNSAKWRATNPEKARKSSAEWRAANPDKARAASRKANAKWRAANPDKARAASRKANAKWRAKKKPAEAAANPTQPEIKLPQWAIEAQQKLDSTRDD